MRDSTSADENHQRNEFGTRNLLTMKLITWATKACSATRVEQPRHGSSGLEDLEGTRSKSAKNSGPVYGLAR